MVNPHLSTLSDFVRFSQTLTLNSAAAKKSAKRPLFLRPSRPQFGSRHGSSSVFSAMCNQSDRQSSPCSSGGPARSGHCFTCGKFGHWRSECIQVPCSGSKSATGNICLGFDENRTCDFCFLNSPHDCIDVKSFEFEDVISVRSSVELPQVSVKG